MRTPKTAAARILIVATIVTASVAGASAVGSAVAAPRPALVATAGSATPPQATEPEAHELTTADVDTWLDGFMPTALRNNDIAGAVVQVVKGGEVIGSQGFGVSNVQTGAPVDPERTVFPVASVSKTFTWTAVMQLVEQGKIDLDANVNDYLDFAIDGKGGPITMRTLMTHTAGFEELGSNGLFDSPGDVIPLESFVKNKVPARIFPPGSTPAYSNYGAALAGYIVQRLSGKPFEEYVEQNIFAPLGMASSSFRQPLPTDLADRVSLGYGTSSEPARPYQYGSDAPAGSLASTAADMGRYMIEHLQDENPGGGKLLQPATAKLMHRTVVKQNPGVNGMALGFYEQNRNGREVIAHGGDLDFFHTEMELYLDDGVGIFVSYNSAGTGATDLRDDLMTAFADRYFPESGADGVDAGAQVERATAVQHANEVAGSYLISRRSESSFLRVAKLALQVTLTANDDGSLSLGGLGQSGRYLEISPYVWQEPGTDKVFTVNADAGTMRLTPSPVVVLDRLPAFDSTLVLGGLIGVAELALVVTVLSWPVAAIIRRRYGVRRHWLPAERRAVVARRSASALMICATAAWVAQILAVLGGAVLDDVPLVATQVLTIGFTVIASVLALVSLVSTLRHRHGPFRVVVTLVWTVALVFLVVQFVDLNLLRVSTSY